MMDQFAFAKVANNRELRKPILIGLRLERREVKDNKIQ